jgi:nitrogenase-associated protein
MEVTFFEKPGCINNTRQKNMIAEAGHLVNALSLLTYQWNKEDLRSYFSGLDIKDWFNPTAPRIKNGEVNPDAFDSETALSEMMKDPLLIRRPLLEVNGTKACGFQNKLVELLLEGKDVSHLQTCPNASTTKGCD